MGDENDSYAMPLETVPTDQILNYLKIFSQQQQVRLIVLGIPRNIRGEHTEMAERIMIFQSLLQTQNYVVTLFDEGTSTRRGMAQMRLLGINSKKSKDKKDEAAAAIILQDYFDFIRSSRS